LGWARLHACHNCLRMTGAFATEEQQPWKPCIGCLRGKSATCTNVKLFRTGTQLRTYNLHRRSAGAAESPGEHQRPRWTRGQRLARTRRQLGFHMSGIAGIYNVNGTPVEREMLQSMRDSLSHRGPDGSAQWIAGDVGLAHLMLHTTPESFHERQPLCDESGSSCLVMDGRVDDRKGLRSALEAQGARLRDDTDAELVLKAYGVWGEQCPAHIIGDFALAIWDGRKRQLFCARDIVGNRPFYYYRGQDTFAFGSEIPPVLVHPRVRRTPNEGHIGEALLWRIKTPDETIFHDIQKIPAATALIVNAKGVRSYCYWTGEHISELRYRTDQEYTEHFLSIYKEVVKSHLRSHCTVGIRLSGGIDSSSITALGKSCLDQTSEHPGLEAYSVVAPGDPDDESTYINQMVGRCGIRSHQFARYEPLASYYADQAVFYKDLPEYPSAITVDGLRKCAHINGVRVLLTGFGGGNWFEGSWDYFAELGHNLKLFSLISQARRFGGPGKPPVSLIRYGIASNLPQLRSLYRRIRGRNLGFVPGWMPTEFIERISLRERLAKNNSSGKLWSRAQQDSYDRTLAGQEVHLSEMEERADSRFQIEGRHPLNDRRVVEFALSLPEEQRRLVPGESKHVLRKSMQGLVPDSVRTRATSPCGSSSVGKTLFSESANRVFDDLKIGEHGWVNASQAREEYRRKYSSFNSGSPEYEVGLMSIWMIYAIETWVRAISGQV
jgi:asparagine synthase (glutamine-hydrolysing)